MGEIKTERLNDTDGTCTFTLSEPVRYTNADGGFSNTQDLTLYSPANVDQPTARHLRQMIVNSYNKTQMNLSILASQMAGAEKFAEKIKEAQEEKKEKTEEKEEPITTSMILSLVYNQDSALIDPFFRKFKQLICSQCCRLDNKMPLKSTIYDNFTYGDKDKLAGVYCAFFLPPSF